MSDASNASILLSIVMPIFGEADLLPATLTAIRKSLEQCSLTYELMLIDDGSSDDTWNVITADAKTYETIRALQLSRNFGKEAALCAGLEHARGDAVIVLDADGQHPPSLIPEMVRVWQTAGVDIVEAVKSHRGRESLPTKAGALLFYFLLNKLSGFDLKGASDFKLMNRKAVNTWLKMPERNVFFRGMTTWMGLTSTQIPFEVVARSAGKSGWSTLKRLKLALVGLTAFSSFPLQLVTFAGAIFFGFAILLGIETLYLKVTGRAVSGFATVILLELLIGSLLMTSLGIIGQYLARIYEEVKGRPRYVIKDSIRLDSVDGNVSGSQAG
jgi:polyisoprenyl-phosphate glycosyltransferase